MNWGTPETDDTTEWEAPYMGEELPATLMGISDTVERLVGHYNTVLDKHDIATTN